MALLQYVVNVGGTLPAVLLADRWGRRFMLLAGSWMMAFCLFATGAYSLFPPLSLPSCADTLAGFIQKYAGEPNTEETRSDINSELSWILRNDRASLAVSTMCAGFVCAYAFTWGPISWVYPAEIFPSGVRSRAVALCTATNWFYNLIVASAVPHLCKWQTDSCLTMELG